MGDKEIDQIVQKQILIFVSFSASAWKTNVIFIWISFIIITIIIIIIIIITKQLMLTC